MAGIGFQLRRLAAQETISSIIRSAGHAAVIAAGPWLFTILALAGITIASDRIAGIETLASFRGIVIYAFAVSLVFAAPVTIAMTRLVGDALWAREPERVRGLLTGGLWVVQVPVLVGVVGAAWLFGLRIADLLALAAMSGIVAGIWVAIAFCGAVRDYTGVTVSFILGLVVALAVCIGLAIVGATSTALAWGFTGGLTVTLAGLISRVTATFPHPVTSLTDSFRAILDGLSRYWTLGLGAFIGSAGIWIDKVVFWFSGVGETLDNGLRHAPLYDSTMFIASLLLVPALASFIVKLETGFFERYQRYYATISGHGTLDQIEDARHRLSRYTMDSLTLITVSLAGLAGVLLLVAPIVVDALGLQYRQIAILRYGALGTLFQFVFIAASALLLFFDRRRMYLVTQTVYLVLSAVLSMATLAWGEDYYGVGFFLAAVGSAAIAFVAADTTLLRLNFLTFIGNNPSVRGARAARRVAKA